MATVDDKPNASLYAQLTEQQWRAQHAIAVACFGEMRQLMQQPLTEPIDPAALLERWNGSIRSLDISQLADDPCFAPPLLQELAVMNTELQALFSARRSAISDARIKQKKARAGINAYRGL
uniref:hypothetical protein n=1 Tax=Marinobacterium profundum TaxID=1714300 RepID=UPI0008301FAC|nr:hypothetical protein [Marinobacterium profundum]